MSTLEEMQGRWPFPGGAQLFQTCDDSEVESPPLPFILFVYKLASLAF